MRNGEARPEPAKTDPKAGRAKRAGPAEREEGIDGQLRNFIEEMDNLLWLTDGELQVTWLNPATARFLERPVDECVGRRITDWIPAERRPAFEKAARAAKKSATKPALAIECRLMNDRGSTLDVLLSLHPVHQRRGAKGVKGAKKLQGFACCARDLSERRGVEERLNASEARLRAVVDAMLDPMVSIDAMGTILATNPAIERVFGYAQAELVGKNVKVLMPEPHRSMHDEYLANYRRTGKTWILGRTRDFEVVRKDGSRIVCALSVSRAEFASGSGPVFTGTFRDVTEKRRAEHQLRESELRFHALFDNSFEYLGLLAVDGRVIEANQTALDAAGLAREEVVGKLFWETRWWSHSKELQDRLREAVHAAARGEFVRFEATHPTHDGGVAEMDFSLKPVRDALGEIAMLLPEGRNISEIKRAQRSETAMLRALAMVGESAALLAHEIKNPITAVNLALRAVADQLGEDHKEVLEDLVTRMQRLEQMMRRTLSFAKPLELKRTKVVPQRLLEDGLAHLRTQTAKAGAEVRLEVAAGIPDLWLDPQLLEEVVANLITNAIEAHLGHARIQLTLARSGEREVLLSIEDDGPGIPESIRATLFKPFVTTKKKGNGFGLAICKKIVEEHGGTIQVGASSLGGARFEIRLPVKP
ncbi:MAG: PAS domain S-box protein [Planctomycetes bacterium]|nr:PAS domain S-box protein [Planctomycetota bacterium]